MEHIHRLSMTERMERQVRQVRTVKHHISMLSIVTMAVRRSLLIRERTLEHISELAPTITKQTLQRLVLTLGQESRERQGQQDHREKKGIREQLVRKEVQEERTSWKHRQVSVKSLRTTLLCRTTLHYLVTTVTVQQQHVQLISVDSRLRKQRTEITYTTVYTSSSDETDITHAL